MPAIVESLIAQELRVSPAGDTPTHAAFRVCEKLRASLVPMLGAAGFRSLVLRAQALASADAPWLAQITIGRDGAIDLSAAIANQSGAADHARDGAGFLGQILGLLETFIGAALTLRLVQDLWPEAAPTTDRSLQQKQQP